MINLLTFFILSWLKLVKVSQGSLWPIENFPLLLVFKLFETFEACFEVFMILLNSEARWIHSTGLHKTKRYSN